MRVVVISRTYINPALRGKLRALAGLGCTIAVAVPEHWNQPISGGTLSAVWGDDAGVRIVPIKVRTLAGRYGGAVWERSTLRKLLRDFRPDVVQIEEEPWSQVASVVTALAARMKIPSVLFSSESIARPYPITQRWRMGRSIRRASGLVGGNTIAAGLLSQGKTGTPTDVIPQLGVSIPRMLTPIPHTRFTIGFVGRLVPEKGLDILLRASVRVLGNWDLVVVGSGPAQEELEGLAERLGIAARITWLGAVPPEDLATVWPRLDTLVLPARTTRQWVEPHGRALIEAMGFGVPVVGSASGALPEIIGPAGLVVTEDDVPALTEAIQNLLDSPPRRIAFAVEGRRRVMNEFVDAAIARKLLGFWERITGKPAPRSVPDRDL
ncbi:MAG: glycosyltransferase family 4 protein [Gemmatimonadota bacterium]